MFAQFVDAFSSTFISHFSVSEMELSDIKINTVDDLQALKKTNYDGVPMIKLRQEVSMLIKRHKYMIYLLSVIRIHIGNQAHSMAIRTINPEIFHLLPDDMKVYESEIDSMLKLPSFGFKWSKTNYSYWVKRFTQNLGPISTLKNKNMYSAGNESFYDHDMSEFVRYISPKIFALNDKVNVQYRNKKVIKWNKVPVYNVKSYFDLFFQDSVSDDMLKDFMNSANWKEFVDDERNIFFDGISAILTGYYSDGKPNKKISSQMDQREISKFEKLQNTNPNRTILSYLIEKFWHKNRRPPLQHSFKFPTNENTAINLDQHLNETKKKET